MAYLQSMQLHSLFKSTPDRVDLISGVNCQSQDKWLHKIRPTISSFLRRCDLIFPDVNLDESFQRLCKETALHKGYPMHGKRSLQPFIPGGVVMASTAYAHLPCLETRVYIALYTAFLIYTDDIFEADVKLVTSFNDRFIKRLPQDDAVLDGFAALLLEASNHFSPLVANLVVTSTLNLVSALLLEHETRGLDMVSAAERYPTFARILSGASEAYALFIFPASVPISWYIQAIPDIMEFINNGNDVLSFYKEELAGETVNRISQLAVCKKCTKEECLRWMVQGAVDSHEKAISIISGHTAALKAYKSFSQGYVGFHAGLPRYRLAELQLDKQLAFGNEANFLALAVLIILSLTATIVVEVFFGLI